MGVPSRESRPPEAEETHQASKPLTIARGLNICCNQTVTVLFYLREQLN